MSLYVGWDETRMKKHVEDSIIWVCRLLVVQLFPLQVLNIGFKSASELKATIMTNKSGAIREETELTLLLKRT